jgi:Zn-dependent protease with chaperone function
VDAALIRARWFDGRSSRAHEVLVSLHPGARGPSLLLHPLSQPSAELLKLEAAQVDWPERWSAGRAPRTVAVDLRDHGSLEVDDVQQWQAALTAAGDRLPLAQRMQTRWTVFLAVGVVALAGLGAFYRWGTPWAATQVTRQVPLEWETGLTARALQDMDQQWFKPSKLPAARQAQLKERFEALARQIEPGMRRYPAYTPKLTLEFRSGFPPNALALPGGTIIMTDALVEAAAAQGLTDDALVGVLAHEIGHVMHRHTTRMLVEQGVLNVGFGLALGDLSVLVSTGGSLLTGLAYRRGHETEADCFAAVLMRKAQLPTTPMADLLLGMEAKHRGDKPAAAAPADEGWASLLSSHPDTGSRARQLKAGHVNGC